MKIKGFTFLEILTVLIIIVIIATIAIPQYAKAVRKCVAVEAVKTARLLGDAFLAYKIEHGVYTTNIESLDVENPNLKEEAKFEYQIEERELEKYVVIAKGKRGTRAEGLKVVYNIGDKSYTIYYKDNPL